MARKQDHIGPAEPVAENRQAKPPRKRFVRMSYVWALLFTLAITAWMMSGHMVVGGRSDSATNAADPAKEPEANAQAKAFRVRVKTITAAPREGVIKLRGRTEADARVQVRAETSGVVESVPVAKGSVVKTGDRLCMIEKAARAASLAEARAAFAQAEADSKASRSLVDRGYTSKLKVTADLAKLDAARANVEKAELELARTEIRAPFEGVVEDIVKVGDYLNAGGMMIGSEGAMTNACAMLVKFDPLLVIGHVSEREVGKLKVGQTGDIRLVTGETVSGRIRFIGSSADAATRTFRVEIEVRNPDRRLRDGVTAEISVPIASQPAHLISPAILALNDEGTVGVRAVDSENRVQFLPVRILADGPEGVYVAGLPERVRVITVGQDYVVEGARVEPVEDAAATAEAQQ